MFFVLFISTTNNFKPNFSKEICKSVKIFKIKWFYYYVIKSFLDCCCHFAEKIYCWSVCAMPLDNFTNNKMLIYDLILVDGLQEKLLFIPDPTKPCKTSYTNWCLVCMPQRCADEESSGWSTPKRLRKCLVLRQGASWPRESSLVHKMPSVSASST